ncbi:ATP-binding protein, partial [Candidatus Woesearchaeota archaeon]|nr:ATP-binding protein [Candidatus Woesearchaeota archaeon]
GKKGSENFYLDLENLKKHFIALGGSGSGKTVLSKVIIEEAILNDIPSLLIDVQGDLSSLALKDKGNLKDKKIIIYTPTSSKGIPLCINPLKLPKKSTKLDKEDLISVLHQISNSICKLLNYDLENSKGKSAQALLYLTLFYAYNNNIKIKTFDKLSQLISDPPDSVKLEASKFLKISEELAKNIKFLTIGQKELMFNFGMPVDIKELLKPGQISIIYLNTLDNEEDKHFFISMICTELYQWMIQNPSKKLQGLFFIDEISEFIPAGTEKPITKPILQLLFKQARKYGIGCIISTQNPGDIDYKAFAQFGTWAIGRLTTKQDKNKIKKSLKSLSNDVDDILTNLSKLQPGQFYIFCPDQFNEVVKMKTRWLYTEHKTLNEQDIKKITDEYREEFTYTKLKTKEETPVKKEKVKSEKSEYFPLNISEEEIHKIAEKNRKKKFLFLGTDEFINEIQLNLRPIIKATVQYNSGLFKKEKYETDILFDGITGDVISLKDNYKILLETSLILDLDSKAMSILNYTIEKKRSSSKLIPDDLKLSAKVVKGIVNKLVNDEILSITERHNEYIFKSNIDRLNIKSINSSLELSDEMQDVEKIEPLVTKKQITNVIENFLFLKLIKTESIYLPYYEIKYKNGMTRLMFINGINGLPIDF